MTIDRIKERVELIKKIFQGNRPLNEASISRQVVEPTLRDLEWPTDDTDVVKYEYSLGKMSSRTVRADIALLHEDKPIVIVEVKKPGSAEGAEEQLFQYAYHAGVSLAVLTTGKEWEVYLPMKPGDYQDRQVYKLDISARETEESASRLLRYLFYPDLCSGEAVKNVEADHGDKARVKKMQDALPKAWREVLLECDDSLVRLLQDKVEDICSYKPDADVARVFIGRQSRAPLPPPRPTPSPRPIPSPRPTPFGDGGGGPKPTGQQLIGFELYNKNYSASSGIETLFGFYEEMIKLDLGFSDKFERESPRYSGKKRRWIASNQIDLYSRRPDLCSQYSRQLSTGHWMSTNYSTLGIEKIIKTACGVAGIDFGTEFKLLYR